MKVLANSLKNQPIESQRKKKVTENKTNITNFRQNCEKVIPRLDQVGT